MTFLIRIHRSDASIPDLPLKPFWVGKKFKKYSRRLVNCSIILTRTDPSSGNVSLHALTINFCELFHIEIFFDFFNLRTWRNCANQQQTSKSTSSMLFRPSEKPLDTVCKGHDATSMIKWPFFSRSDSNFSLTSC